MNSRGGFQAREGGAPPQAGTIPPREDSSLSQATTSSLPQASAPQAGAIPPREDNSLSQATTSSLSQASALLPSSEGEDLPTLPVPKQVYLAIKTTLLGKAAGTPLGTGPPRPPRRSTPPPGKAIIPSSPH